jgi:hypothetical protein
MKAITLDELKLAYSSKFYKTGMSWGLTPVDL